VSSAIDLEWTAVSSDECLWRSGMMRVVAGRGTMGRGGGVI
jgi:hypothetical protein